LQRVVITGVGVVSPIGADREAFWRSCLEGRSGVVRLDTPWVTETDLTTRIGAPVQGFDAESALPPKLASLVDPVGQYALAAAQQAVADAGLATTASETVRNRLDIDGVDPARLVTIIGSGIGGLTAIEASHGIWRERRSKAGVKRYALPMLIPNAPAAQVAIRFGAKGESKSLSTACAAGTMSIGDAYRMLATGAADVALTGGAEAVVNDDDSYGLMGFDRLKTMSTRNDEPERASRPFDLHRDGFVLGEGAAVFVMEREPFARARGARAYATLAGYSTNCDAHSMMQPEESGEMIVDLIRAALADAGLEAGHVDHVSAHATSTRLNDKTEARALRAMFGSRCDDIRVTGLKSMTGHAIGASGALETAALALSYRHGMLTPTINYETPDPECDVNVVANRPVAHTPEVSLKLSYGFGGHNACLVLARP